MPTWGDTAALNEIDFDNIHYFVKSSDRTEQSWDDVPDDIKKTFDRLGIPEAERKFLSGVSAQYESEVVYHSVIEELEKDGVLFCDMDTALKQYPEIVKKYLATVIPVARQQVRRAQQRRVVGRFVRLRPQGRRSEDAAAGLLPHQHREHGPVRAHADHRRRRREGPLHRGLHRTEVLDVVAAFGRRRADRDGRRVDPLHDDPELVPQHLQPRHQTRRRLQERDGRMGRRQHRLALDHEVSGDLSDGRRRARRDPLGGVRRRRPASGCGREGHPRRAEHDLGRDQQVGLGARREDDLPRPGRDLTPAPSARRRA